MQWLLNIDCKVFVFFNKKNNAHFTCSAKAKIPAASGAEADVPVWLMVHLFFKSVVT